MQNAWVSDDIESLAHRWAEDMGVGPFFFMEQEFANSKYRGRATPCRFKVAIAQAGAVQIELIQPLTDEPSAYRETVEPGQTALHHMCIASKDFAGDVAYFNALGYETVQEGSVGGARVVYLDTRSMTGYMLEIIEFTPVAEVLFGAIAEICSHWDGKDAWRSMETLMG